MSTIRTKALALILAAFLIYTLNPCMDATAQGIPASDQPVLSASPPADTSVPGAEGNAAGKESLDAAEKKIGSNLLQLLKPELMPAGVTQDDWIKELETSRQLTRGPAQDNPDALLAYVYIRLTEGANEDELRGYVSQITDIAPDCGLVVAQVEVNRLAALAALGQVKSIEAVTPPECCGAGSVKSQGDSALNADVARALGGVDGAGMKIGVISDGVDSVNASIASGDVPSGTVVLGNAQGGSEGTAMLEIVHDLAPGAQLYFHDCGKNVVQFASAIDELVAAGCNVICDDIKWYSEPFFEDGYVASHITSLLASKNIIYVTSSGNAAKQHYQGRYRAGEKGYHDFSAGSDAAHQYLYLSIPRGGSVDIWLQWDDAFGCSANDYDLYLYDKLYGKDKFAAWSTASQTGSQNPLEHISFTNRGTSSDFLICVNKYGAAEPRNLEVMVNTAGGASMYGSNTVAADSIVGHAAVPGVISCGAVDCVTPNTIEDYSCQGPVTMLTGVRAKPDICGVDGVSITGAGGFGGEQRKFYGTSASSAHIAAVAALVWKMRPELSAAQVKAQLCGTARDIGAGGYDAVYGYGRADTCLAALGAMDLPAPERLRQTAGTSGSVTLGWQDAPYADGYEVWRASSAYGTYSRIAMTAAATLTDSGLTFNKAYYYKVRLYRKGLPDAYGAFSTAVTAKPLPAAPNLKAAPASYKSVKLSWGRVAGATHYEVYRAVSKYGQYKLVRSTASCSYTNTGITTGKTYYYKVKAYKLVSGKKVYGAYSGAVSARAGIGVPTGVKAAAASPQCVKISWGKVAGRTKYEVWRSATSATGSYTLVNSTTSTSYTNRGLTAGRAYWYKVRAYRMVGGKKVYGGYSGVVCGNP